MTEAYGTGKGAARFWAKVAAGDWDAVIVRPGHVPTHARQSRTP